MTKLKESRQNSTGGLPADVISDQKAWNMGQATSGSRAPSSHKRARVVFLGTGIGSLCSLLSINFERTASLAFAICPSQLAV
jgi:hypothetical protein